MTRTASAITVTGSELVTISAAEHARAQRDSLLALFAGLAPITDAASAAAVANALREAKGFTRLIEGARSEAKAPALDFGRRVDAIARELSATVDEQAAKLSRVHGAWLEEQRRLEAEAKQKAWEQEQAIKRAAFEAEQAAQREAQRVAAEAAAAAAKVQSELAAKAARARTEEGRSKAEAAAAAAAQQAAVDAENRRQAEEDAAAKREADRTAAIIDTRVAASAVMPARQAWVALRRDVEFEVTDILALYEAAPFLVTLTPNNAAIKSALKGLQAGQSLPGVTHRWVSSTNTR
jgi:hypothetical protein